MILRKIFKEIEENLNGFGIYIRKIEKHGKMCYDVFIINARGVLC